MNSEHEQMNHHATTTRPTERPGFWASWAGLLSGGWQAVRAGGSRLLALMLACHLAGLLLAFPILTWLFREALRATGLGAVDLSALQLGSGATLTLGLIVLICALAFWFAALQFAVLVLVLRRARAGLPLSFAAVGHDLVRVARKLVRPSSLPLVGYLFVLLPLTGFGFTTVLAQGIAIPSFISGELLKSPTSAAIFIGFMLLLAFLNVRFALTLPVFSLTDATGGKSLRASWRLTRGAAVLPLLCAVLAVLVAAAFATLAIVVTALVPTAIADEIAPAASPVIAAYSLGIAQVIGAVLTACVTSMLAAMLVEHLTRYAERLPATLPLRALERGAQPRLRSRAVTGTLVAAATAASLLLGTLAIDTMHRLADQPETLVLAHRGFSDGGVENTLSGLNAAAAAGADLVEMDVMQARDGEFVAMHDANLLRLAGTDIAVKDLTLDQLTQVTVRDLAGHEDFVPSFSEYVTRADELGMPLLIEIKLGGGDTEDHVERLVAELEALGSLERHIYHSLDPASVAELKHLRPNLTVGYTMAFAGLGIPETPADFIVVEEWSATQAMQDEAERAGLGFMSWTVNDETGMRELLRRNVDGIITDHPDSALQARTEMQQDTGLAEVLTDALTRFVVVF